MSEWPKYRTEKIIQAAEIKAIHNDFGQGEYFLWVDPGTGTLAQQIAPLRPAAQKKAMKIGIAIDTGPGGNFLYCCDPGPLINVKLIDVWKCPKCGHSEDLK